MRSSSQNDQEYLINQDNGDIMTVNNKKLKQNMLQMDNEGNLLVNCDQTSDGFRATQQIRMKTRKIINPNLRQSPILQQKIGNSIQLQKQQLCLADLAPVEDNITYAKQMAPVGLKMSPKAPINQQKPLKQLKTEAYSPVSVPDQSTERKSDAIRQAQTVLKILEPRLHQQEEYKNPDIESYYIKRQVELQRIECLNAAMSVSEILEIQKQFDQLSAQIKLIDFKPVNIDSEQLNTLNELKVTNQILLVSNDRILNVKPESASFSLEQIQNDFKTFLNEQIPPQIQSILTDLSIQQFNDPFKRLQPVQYSCANYSDAKQLQQIQQKLKAPNINQFDLILKLEQFLTIQHVLNTNSIQFRQFQIQLVSKETDQRILREQIAKQIKIAHSHIQEDKNYVLIEEKFKKLLQQADDFTQLEKIIKDRELELGL
ncbi:Hypothetical_protein [Hexamita inflata]|uniref:Hypothetical_protein n=1 Tax=Hexamita inflata TaxID=28002 RepID=A0AA86NH72_9EUKA|nr:Hypothetical protein HINF_LOCUS7389 [Hexamita inflata]